MVAQAVTEHASPGRPVGLGEHERTHTHRTAAGPWELFLLRDWTRFFLKQLELVEDAVQGGHVCLGLSLKTMNTCLLFTSLYLRTVGDGDGHTLFNTSLVLITVPYR